MELVSRGIAGYESEGIIKLSDVTYNHEWLPFIQKERFFDYYDELDRIIIDCTNLGFMTPLRVASLACLVECYHRHDIDIIFFGSDLQDPFQYLKSIRFFDYWNKGFNRNAYTPNNKSTSLCLWQISNSMIESYVRKAQEYFQNIHLPGLDLYPLNIALSESFNNIFDHAKSPIDGYTITQYYHNIKRIRLAVCDFGKGICQTIKEHQDIAITSLQAMDLAFTKGYSIKSRPANAGLGLVNLINLIKDTSGRIDIYTNDIHAIVLGSGKYTIEKGNFDFQGTLLAIEIDTKNLSKQEIDINIDNLYF